MSDLGLVLRGGQTDGKLGDPLPRTTLLRQPRVQVSQGSILCLNIFYISLTLPCYMPGYIWGPIARVPTFLSAFSLRGWGNWSRLRSAFALIYWLLEWGPVQWEVVLQLVRRGYRDWRAPDQLNVLLRLSRLGCRCWRAPIQLKVRSRLSGLQRRYWAAPVFAQEVPFESYALVGPTAL